MQAIDARHTAATTDDWRILRALTLYRLLLVGLLLGMQESGYTPSFFEKIHTGLFRATSLGYVCAALLLLWPVFRQWPGLTTQAMLHFAVDALAVTLLVYACNGVDSGMGVLLITPMVGCSLILPTRAALFEAAAGTLLMFGEEILRQLRSGFSASETTAAGILGVIFFATTVAGNTVARRARRSEAMATQAGNELAELLHLNKRIVETMETGVLTVEADGTIRMANAAARRLLNRGHIEGMPLDAVTPSLATALARWRRAEEPTADADEDVVPRFMPLGEQAQAQTLILLDDATQLRARAQQMKLAALGQLTAHIAHEIRNPLSAIGHAGQLLAESTSLAAEDRRLVEMIGRQSQRIDKIVEDVLSLSRRDPVAPSRIALRPWLKRSIALYGEAHPDEARPIDVDGVADNLVVHFDPHHLQQILHNLWNNSFEHGGGDGRAISVRLDAGRQRGSHLPYLEIADDGPGIPGRIVERIFDPFFTTARNGTGLGLYIARELCEYNRARLHYEARAQGACFRIVFAAA